MGIIAGNGRYPAIFARAARQAGVRRLVAAAFQGETDPSLAGLVDEIAWLRVGQLSRLLRLFQSGGVHHAVMAGQIAPRNLFDLRPDIRALRLLVSLKERNAESIFGAIADELQAAAVRLLPATTFLEHLLPEPGPIGGPTPAPRTRDDIRFGMRVAKEISRLDIGQTVVVRRGTVLAVEGFEGTDETIARGGRLGRRGAVVVKVSKPGQDLRFDVPVIGERTLRVAAEAGIAALAVEARSTLLLERESLAELASSLGIVLWAEAPPGGREGPPAP